MLLLESALGGTCPFMTGVNPIEKELADMKLKFIGVEPVVTRVATDGPKKIVITKYSHVPTIETVDGAVVVKAGTCSDTGAGAGATATATTEGPTEASSASGTSPTFLTMTVA